jgi:hypothetical protein
MRIKFEKGMTPERMADAFVKYIYDNNIVIGAVNMYIQTYDEEMKPEKFEKGKDSSYLNCSPSAKAKQEYDDYVAEVRRGNFKAVSNK